MGQAPTLTLVLVFVLSSASASAPGLLPSFLQHSASAVLWYIHPCPETCPSEGCRGSSHSLDRSHDPEGTHNICWRTHLYLVLVVITQNSFSNNIGTFAVQVLHLIGQALQEEKAQLEDCTVEEVTFDFSLKACSEWKTSFVQLMFIPLLKTIKRFCFVNFFSLFTEIGSEHGKSVFLLLSKIKAVPSLEAQKDMVKWVLQVRCSSQFLVCIFHFQHASRSVRVNFVNFSMCAVHTERLKCHISRSHSVPRNFFIKKYS